MSLAAEARARGYRLECFDTLASTNDEAMRRAHEGDAGKLWIVAAEQSSGRGRRGRTWVSTRGNLHCSLLLIDPCAPARLPELGFVCGVALAELLTPSLGQRLKLKWPNDALVDGAKISGILLEAATIGGRLACVAGIGVNCSTHPRDMPYMASDLATAGVPLDAGAVFEGLSAQLGVWLERWARGKGFENIRAAWLAHAGGLGETIDVTTGRDRRRGIFRSLDEQGRLILDTPHGREIIEAGDVFLPMTTASTGVQGRN